MSKQITIQGIAATMTTTKGGLFPPRTEIRFESLDERNTAAKIFREAGHSLHHSGSGYSGWLLADDPAAVEAALAAVQA